MSTINLQASGRLGVLDMTADPVVSKIHNTYSGDAGIGVTKTVGDIPDTAPTPGVNFPLSAPLSRTYEVYRGLISGIKLGHAYFGERSGREIFLKSMQLFLKFGIPKSTDAAASGDVVRVVWGLCLSEVDDDSDLTEALFTFPGQTILARQPLVSSPLRPGHKKEFAIYHDQIYTLEHVSNNDTTLYPAWVTLALNADVNRSIRYDEAAQTGVLNENEKSSIQNGTPFIVFISQTKQMRISACNSTFHYLDA